jgi:hypothetical protein
VVFQQKSKKKYMELEKHRHHSCMPNKEIAKQRLGFNFNQFVLY